MPQVDPAAVCGGTTDREITCESTAAVPLPDDPDPDSDPHPDYAPVSFWLSEDAELDWLDRNAIIERKDSGKGGAAPPASGPPYSGNLKSGSQRYAVSIKSRASASIFGLPKPQKTGYADSNHRRLCRPRSVWVLPKRSESASGKSTVSVTEPSSPKVSCMGRVRSRRECSRRAAANHRRNRGETLTRSRSGRKKQTGFWSNFRSMFRSKGWKPEEEKGSKEEAKVENARKVKKRELSKAAARVEAPRLGAAQRFSSGRKTGAWAADVEVDGLNTERMDGGSI